MTDKPMTPERLEEIRERVGGTSCAYAAADCFAHELLAEIDRLRAALEKARADALEEAAKACDGMSFLDTTPQKQIGARMCANKIRSLKEPTP